MKFYDSRRAPNPRRVRWVMAMKGITDIEIVMIDIMKGEHRTSDYLAKTGIANVPALELDDGTVITESVAICRYLESLYPDPNMFGHDARETAVIEMWTRRVEMTVATPLMVSVRHSHPALAVLEHQIPAIASANIATATRALDMVDARLGESRFIAADRPTMADVVAYTALDFARLVKFKPDPALVHVARWMEDMRRLAETLGADTLR